VCQQLASSQTSCSTPDQLLLEVLSSRRLEGLDFVGHRCLIVMQQEARRFVVPRFGWPGLLFRALDGTPVSCLFVPLVDREGLLLLYTTVKGCGFAAADGMISHRVTAQCDSPVHFQGRDSAGAAVKWNWCVVNPLPIALLWCS
jgi:hypothetical protein